MIKTELAMSTQVDRVCAETVAPSTNAPRHHPGFFQTIHHPLGFPVRVTSNSKAVLDAAEQSWGCFRPMFQNSPLEIELGVKKNGEFDKPLPPEPVHSLNGNLLTNSADEHNFFVADLVKGRAIGWVTETTAAAPLYLRYSFLEAAALSMISTLRAVAVHGACVLVRGCGMLLCGDSGAGKSTLAYAGARSGWTYVSDDASYALFDTEERVVVGNYHKIRFRPSAAELFPEIGGRPITPRAIGKPSIEVRVSEWPQIFTAPAAPVNQIIFLNRRSAQQELISLSSSSVLPWFMQNVIAIPGSRTLQEAAISRLLECGVYELRYRDLSWAVQRITQLANTGR